VLASVRMTRELRFKWVLCYLPPAMPGREWPKHARAVESDQVGQRRHVTLLFCDLCDYTSLSEACDPEEVDALRRRIEALASDAIGTHGGAITQYYGDGILAVFGLPLAQEQDVRCAIDAALALRSALRALQPDSPLPAEFELRMHFGVHSGLVFAREGDSLHGRYELTGDAVNTAARLCSVAQRDEILVSERAMRGIEPFYDSRVVSGLKLKGKHARMAAYRIHGSSNVRTRFEASARRGLTTFVSRDDELVQLANAARAAEQGSTQTIGIVGSAGMGKTRLLDEFARLHGSPSWRCFRGYGESYGNVAPLQPFAQILRQIFDLRTDSSIEHASLAVSATCEGLGASVQPYVEIFLNVLALDAAGRSLDARDSHRKLVAALCALIRALPTKLVILMVDDWQWVDDLSHHVLRRLMRGVERRLLVILAARNFEDNDVIMAQAQRIELRPLHPEESTRVIRSLLPRVLDVGITTRLYRRAGGNPLFLEELCRSLPSDTPKAERAFEQDEVPHTLHGVIQARMQKLPPRDLELLRAASVIGNEFPTALIQHISGDSDIAAALERLASDDLVRPSEEPGMHRFKHGITHEVVYESVRLAERSRIHSAIASTLEKRAQGSGSPEPYEALAHHYLGSGDHARAAHYAERAGDKAAATSALDRARVQYGTALSELDQLEPSSETKRRWLAVSMKWARAWVYDPAPAHLAVLDRSKRLAEELGDQTCLADVEQMGAWICYALGEQPRAIGHCERGLALAEQIGNQKLVGQLLSNLGQSHAAAGNYPVALECLDRAMRIKRERAVSREHVIPVGFAYALGSLATVHADRGDFALAHEALDQALDSLKGTGHAIEGSVFGLRAMIELWQGEWARCIDSCARAGATAERIHGPYVFSISRAMSSYARFRLERDPEDCKRLCEAADWLQARNMGLYLSMVYGAAAEACCLLGDDAGARDYASRALQRASERDPFGEVIAHRVLATLDARSKPADDARVRAALECALGAADARGSARERALVQLLQARLWHEAGQHDAARTLLTTLRAPFEAMCMSHFHDELDALFRAQKASGHGDVTRNTESA
jgi:class 3 adenylate cyclase/tetratricopeptide (TPR) repeat protein